MNDPNDMVNMGRGTERVTPNPPSIIQQGSFIRINHAVA
jgi:hypothetical protein